MGRLVESNVNTVRSLEQLHLKLSVNAIQLQQQDQPCQELQLEQQKQLDPELELQKHLGRRSEERRVGKV